MDRQAATGRVVPLGTVKRYKARHRPRSAWGERTGKGRHMRSDHSEPRVTPAGPGCAGSSATGAAGSIVSPQPSAPQESHHGQQTHSTSSHRDDRMSFASSALAMPYCAASRRSASVRFRVVSVVTAPWYQRPQGCGATAGATAGHHVNAYQHQPANICLICG